MTCDNDIFFERVRQVAARTFRRPLEEVTAETGVGKLEGWDSLGHLTLMMEIEREFAVRFSTEQISHPKSVMEICRLLQLVRSNG